MGKSGYIQVCNQGNTRSDQRLGYQVKDFSIPGMGRCNPLVALNSLLSHAPQLWGAGCQLRFLVHLAFPPAPEQSRAGLG